MDSVVVDQGAEAAGFVKYVQYQGTAERVRHAHTVNLGRDVVPGLDLAFIGVEGFDDRTAAGGLHRDHARQRAVQPANLLEFIEHFPHRNQADAAAGWKKDELGQAPAELFGEFEAHRLFAFHAVRLFQRRHVEPAHFPGTVGDDFAAVPNQAVDSPRIGTVKSDFAGRDLRRVGGREDE